MFLFTCFPMFLLFCFFILFKFFRISFFPLKHNLLFPLEPSIRIYFQVYWRGEQLGRPYNYFCLPPLTSPDHRRNLSTLNLRFCLGGRLLFKFLIYLQLGQVLTFIAFKIRNFASMSGNTKSRLISQLGSNVTEMFTRKLILCKTKKWTNTEYYSYVIVRWKVLTEKMSSNWSVMR